MRLAVACCEPQLVITGGAVAAVDVVVVAAVSGWGLKLSNEIKAHHKSIG